MHAKPAIFNIDQGSQFTSAPFAGLRLKNGVAISMGGRGLGRDDVFVERLWRPMKYEGAYETVAAARWLIGEYLDFYNRKRPHSSLRGRVPDDTYFNPLTPLAIGVSTLSWPLGRLSDRATPPWATTRPPHATQPTGRGAI